MHSGELMFRVSFEVNQGAILYHTEYQADVHIILQKCYSWNDTCDSTSAVSILLLFSPVFELALPVVSKLSFLRGNDSVLSTCL